MTTGRIAGIAASLALGLGGLCGCGAGRAPEQADARIPSISRGNLGAEEFKQALVGNWISVFKDEHTPGAAVERLVISADGTAALTVSRGEHRQEYSGRWELSFERAPDPGMLTIGSIQIAGDGKTVTLTRVYFGFHNGMIDVPGPYLRIGGDPYGVLARASEVSATTVRKEPRNVIILDDEVYPCRIIKQDGNVSTVELTETREIVTVEWVANPRAMRGMGNWKILSRQPAPPPIKR
jgi:hypothetical protein